MNNSWLKYIQKHDLSAMFDTTKEYRRWLKAQYREHGTYVLGDGLAHSMRDGRLYQRFRADEDGEGWRHYGFVEFDPEDVALATDREIDEWFEDNMAIRIYSDYDCTGRAFTRWIDWHRNPDGSISFVHAVGLDE